MLIKKYSVLYTICRGKWAKVNRELSLTKLAKRSQDTPDIVALGMINHSHSGGKAGFPGAGALTSFKGPDQTLPILIYFFKNNL